MIIYCSVNGIYVTNASYNLGVIVGFISKKESTAYQKDFYLFVCINIFDI